MNPLPFGRRGAAALAVMIGAVLAPVVATAETSTSLTFRPASWGYIDARQPYTTFLNPPDGPSAGATRDAARKRHVTRSFFTYDLPALRDTTLTGAEFRVQQTFSSDCVARPVELWLTGPMTASSTWQNPPEQRRFLDSKSSASGGGAGCPASLVTFSLSDAVQRTLAAGQPTLTLGLRVPAASETDLAYGKRYAAGPELAITTSNPAPPHEPVGLFVASAPGLPGYSCDTMTTRLIRTTTPVVGVSSGAPAFNTDRPNLRAAFEFTRASGEPLLSQSVAFVGSGAAFQAPPGVLTDGAYQVRARAEDGAAVSGWLPWCAFTIDSSGSVPVPGVPDTLRLSTGPYAGFQQCGASSGDPVAATGDSLGFAADPTPHIIGVTYPNLSSTFEIGHPGQEPLIRQTRPIWPSGLVFGAGTAPGTLAPGSYQFRVRAEDGSVVSAWSPWCLFTVTP